LQPWIIASPPERGSPPGVLAAVWGSLLDDLDRDQAGWLGDVLSTGAPH
jgi:hypothetical protein